MNQKMKFQNLVPTGIKFLLKDSCLDFYRLLFREIRNRAKRKSSYGQTGEDILLQKYLPQKSGFYIDIGAGRPITGSNTYIFYRLGWRGICVDPISKNYRLLKLLRSKDKIFQTLVGPKSEAINFWEFEPYVFSTVDEKVANLVKNYPGVKLLEHSKRSVVPLSEYALEIPENVPTLLSVDVEGYDLEVLKSNDWKRFRPTIICVEEWLPNIDVEQESEICVYLFRKGYKRVAYTGLSSIFMHSDT